MAETLLSPGVLTRENDQTLITQGPISAGAAILGPTVKGPVNVPTLVSSYSDYKSKFGGAFESASIAYEYLTSIAAYNYFQQGGESILVTRIVSGTYLPATASVAALGTGSGDYTTGSFTLTSLSQGDLMNNSGSVTTSGSLVSGSGDNIRWEVASLDSGSGQFSLLIRRGDDNSKNKSILETWNDLSLDPNSPNYIEAVIGNQAQNFDTDSDGNRFIQITGSYVNNSRYVRVSSVTNPTLNYLDNDGNFKPEYTSSLPKVGSGSVNAVEEEGAFGGAAGAVYGLGTGGQRLKMFDEIDVSSIQGVAAADYTASIALLENKDEYDFEVITAPGVTIQNGAIATNTLITTVTERGDAISVIDTRNYGATVNQALTSAGTVDSSYAATYWPWVQVLSPETNKLVFVPASTLIPAVYATNDRLGAEWFAPAGFNRGGVGGAIQAERKLPPGDRDKLYAGKVNPIASFPGQGPVIFGQKTLQTKATALDRVNVRRLLIEVKRVIGQIGEGLLFEQNTAATRGRFLNQVNPFLESIQQRQGIFAFRVVMDDTNNTPDVIDRNQLVGQIFIQPTRTAEFIILDFNVTPTGVEI
ncbi:phage tail sheath subtilisin-like domain-containing protein [bacterium]|nr:phage tail sheath subtilisin-like domain-containing protein [bacterium]